ncbi:Zn(2)-C6 fungal-type domain-containing protein [Schizosaccharomyces pombe]
MQPHEDRSRSGMSRSEAMELEDQLEEKERGGNVVAGSSSANANASTAETGKKSAGGSKPKRRRGERIPPSKRIRKAIAYVTNYASGCFGRVERRLVCTRSISRHSNQKLLDFCVECKKHKIKCVGNFPCGRCLKKGLECVIETPPRLLMNKDEISLNLQRLSHMETILSKLMPSLSLDLPSLEAKIAELSESLQTYPDKVLTDIELGSYQQVTLNETQTYYEDAGSNESFVARVHEIICQGREFQVQHKLTNKGNKTFEDILDPADNTVASLIHALPPKDITFYLLMTFWQFSSDNNHFYYNTKLFAAKVHHLFDDPTSFQSKDGGFVCMLLLSMAMGSLFSYIRHPEFLSDENHDRWTYPGSQFYQNAKLLFPKVISESSLETVQSFFLAGMYLSPTLAHEVVYMYFGIAMRAAVANGMHKKSANAQFSGDVAELRKRLFWSVYCMERKIGISLGRPESLVRSEIDIHFPEYRESLDSQNFIASFRTFTLAIKISLLTNKVYDMWYSSLHGKANLKAATIKEIVNEIEAWRQQLSPDLEIQNIGPDSRSYRGIVHLHLAYHIVRIAMGRPFLLHRLRERTMNSKTDEGARLLTDKLISYCYSSALHIVDLLVLLRMHKFLSVYSFMDYHSCHAASFIILVHLLINPSEQTIEQLNTAIDILNFVTDRFPLLKGSTDVITNLRAFAEQSEVYQSRLNATEPAYSTQVPFFPRDADYHNQINLQNLWNDENINASLEALFNDAKGFGFLLPADNFIFPSDDGDM